MSTQRKVPAGPKAQPGKGSKGSRKQASPTGIDPGNPHYGIKNTAKKHGKGAITQPSGRNVPTGQDVLTSKVKRQAY